MFDYVFVKTSMLPVSESEAKIIGDKPGWQTKDLDCQMTEIYITEEGKLQVNKWTYEIVPKEERPHPEDDGILGMMGMLKRVNEHLEDITTEPTLTFYSDVKGKWYEFTAIFENAKLKEIIRH